MDTRDPTGATVSGAGQDPTLAAVWGQFYAYCFAVINACPGVRRLSSSDREDCVQDVMLEIVRKFGEHRPESIQDQFVGWVRLVSRNKAADIARRRARKPEVNFEDGAGGAVVDSLGLGGDLDSPPGEYVSLVWEALLSLDAKVPVTSYLVFYLRTIEGWSIREISELFQISPDQAKARCHRVKKKFGSILEQQGRSRSEGGVSRTDSPLS